MTSDDKKQPEKQQKKQPEKQTGKQSNLLVPIGGKGSNPKTVLYVGGLEENVTEQVLTTAFIPFGEIKEVNIPLDNTTGKHRGFGFVEFEEKEEAAYAIDNMHQGEVYGKILTVNYAQPMKIKGGDKGFSHQPIWSDMDRYLNELEADTGSKEDLEAQMLKRQSEAFLQDKTGITPDQDQQQVGQGQNDNSSQNGQPPQKSAMDLVEEGLQNNE